MAVDEDDEEQEMDTMKDQGSSKVKGDSLPSYLSEKTRSWEEPTPSSPYQFNNQPDTQEQVLNSFIYLNEIHYNKWYHTLIKLQKKWMH